MRSVRLLARVAGVVLLLAASPAATRAAGPAHGAGPAPAAKTTYLRYCSACHGESGKGDGVVAHLMQPRPTDLTALAKRNNGVFPYAQVMNSIDGRESIRAHGDPDMPVWGELFEAQEGMSLGRQASVRGKLMLITDYLATIQAK
jgi:mono/diheme cytochrome c family protein